MKMATTSSRRIRDATGGARRTQGTRRGKKMGKCCCCDSIPKKNWVWGWRMPPPGGKNQSSRGRRSGDEGGGPDLNLELCYHVTR